MPIYAWTAPHRAWMALAVACLWAMSSVVQKHVLDGAGEAAATSFQLAVSGVFFAGSLAIKLWRDGDVALRLPSARAAVPAIAASGVLGFVVAYRVLLLLIADRETEVHRTIALSYTTPAIVAVLAAALLGEAVGARTAVGIALVVVGGALV